MNPSIMPEVQAEAKSTKTSLSSTSKDGVWVRTWITGFISLFLIVALSAGSAGCSVGSLLVQIGYGEREGGGGGGGLGECSEK